MHIHYNDLYDHVLILHVEPQLCRSWNLQFCQTLPWSSLIVLNLSDPSLFHCRPDKKKKYCIFTIWPGPNTRTPSPGGHDIWYYSRNFGRLFLVHHSYALILSELCPKCRYNNNYNLVNTPFWLMVFASRQA